MKFRTEVTFQESTKKILPESKVFGIGSCFAAEMAGLLKQGQLQVLDNPYGTLFNPYSVNAALKKIHQAENYVTDDLISYSGKFISLDHHTFFSAKYAHIALEKINSKIEEANQFLQETDFVLITYGTSFIHEFLPKKKLVANCHKIPSKFFEKRLLTHLELTDSIYETIQILRDICKPGVQMVFTVSPVRHTKDGFVENTLSKSKLITALHDVISDFDFCEYLPVYEVIMDELRDYRFYREDMVHPTEQAVNYIFEKFGASYFSEKTMDFVEENFRIASAMNHRASDENSEEFLEFRKKIEEKIKIQQEKVKHQIFSDLTVR